MKKELTLCLPELTEDDTESEHSSEDWLKTVDRGRLKYVKDITYTLFSAMEHCMNSKKKSEVQDLTQVTHVVNK